MFIAVARLAREQIQPLVREMDEKSEMAASVRQALFENGVSVSKKPQKSFSF
jgi:hypothetical protein